MHWSVLAFRHLLWACAFLRTVGHVVVLADISRYHVCETDLCVHRVVEAGRRSVPAGIIFLAADVCLARYTCGATGEGYARPGMSQQSCFMHAYADT